MAEEGGGAKPRMRPPEQSRGICQQRRGDRRNSISAHLVNVAVREVLGRLVLIEPFGGEGDQRQRTGAWVDRSRRR